MFNRIAETTDGELQYAVEVSKGGGVGGAGAGEVKKEAYIYRIKQNNRRFLSTYIMMLQFYYNSY